MSVPTGDPTAVSDVLIVGAGPVGMMLALDLAARGVRSTLIERAERSRMYPKGNTHNARTMEHYRRLGLAEAVRASGLPADHPTDVAYFTTLNGFELQRLRMPTSIEKLAVRDRHDPLDQVPEPLHRGNQMYVERLLFDRVRSTGLITGRFGYELVDLHDTGDRVEVDIRATDGGPIEHVAGAFLVGCDGPQSLVRKKLGGRYQGEDARESGFMSGLTHSSHVRLPRWAEEVGAKPAWQYWILRPDAVANLVTLGHNDEYIFHAIQGDAADPDSVTALLAECAGGPVTVEVLDAQDWIAGRALVSDVYGVGRVLLSGDAVHLFTPTGGFGMNTGIDDAANLAWKLAAVLQGWGGPGLLDTYARERRPIAVRNTRAALDRARSIKDIPLGPVLESDSVEGKQARAVAAEILAGFTEEFASLGIQLGARYDDSPITVGDGTPAPPDDPGQYVPTGRPGGRAPHVWLADGRSLFDAFGPGFTLLRLEPSPDRPDAPDRSVDDLLVSARARGVPLTCVDVPVPGARALYAGDLALVRPDQHIGWRGDRLPDIGRLLDAVTGH